MPSIPFAELRTSVCGTADLQGFCCQHDAQRQLVEKNVNTFGQTDEAAQVRQVQKGHRDWCSLWPLLVDAKANAFALTVLWMLAI